MSDLTIIHYYEEHHLYGKLCSLNGPCDSCPSPYRNECSSIEIPVCFSCATRLAIEGADVTNKIIENYEGRHGCSIETCNNYV